MPRNSTHKWDFLHLRVMEVLSKGKVTDKYNMRDLSKMTQVPYEGIKYWLHTKQNDLLVQEKQYGKWIPVQAVKTDDEIVRDCFALAGKEELAELISELDDPVARESKMIMIEEAILQSENDLEKNRRVLLAQVAYRDLLRRKGTQSITDIARTARA